MSKNTVKIRINGKLKKEIERSMPGIPWAKRQKALWDTSLIKYKDPMGSLLFGKKAWEKEFGQKNKKKPKR